MIRNAVLASLALMWPPAALAMAPPSLDSVGAAKAAARELCQRPEMHSSAYSAGAAISAKAELVPTLLKYLANVGFTAELKGQTTQTFGLLQRDIGAALESSNHCAADVYKATLTHFDIKPKPIQRVLKKNQASNENAAATLERLAVQLTETPHTLIGEQITVTSQPGASGNITGKVVTVTGGPRGGTLIGSRVTVGGDCPAPAANEIVGEDICVDPSRIPKLAGMLRTEAVSARVGGASKAAIDTLIDQVRQIANPNDAAAVEAATAASAKLDR